MNNIPKVFWAFYDLYRRKLLTLDDFSKKTCLDKKILCKYLRQLSKSQNCNKI